MGPLLASNYILFRLSSLLLVLCNPFRLFNGLMITDSVNNWVGDYLLAHSFDNIHKFQKRVCVFAMCPNLLQVSWRVGVCVWKVSLLLVPLGLGVESIFFILKHWVSRREMGEARFLMKQRSSWRALGRVDGVWSSHTMGGRKTGRKTTKRLLVEIRG